jgi:hypothetical protein
MNRVGKFSICCVGVIVAASVFATDQAKKQAHVTQIIRDVKLLPPEAAPRSATINDHVEEDTPVRTGDESRSELTFEDLTITRLGANTIFSFNKAGRSVQLDSGSILLRVPKDSGGAELRTKAVTVGITGTTVILESTPLGDATLIALEGHARLTLVEHPQESAEIHAGQMLEVAAGATEVPTPEDVDLAQIMESHPLIADFPPSANQDIILTEIDHHHPTVGGAHAPQPTPRIRTPRPTPGITPTYTSSPRTTPFFTPTPKSTSIFTPPPRPKPASTSIPRPTQRPAGASQIPPQVVIPPRKATPTPTPPKIR